ncbi:hypothetical protein [Epilithonimonas sp.]|uniref:hypothetical protein n=1 Tax=Epilithonimonas sp. TaxID=2894511 RepID=UPI002897071B|nr:hypothetical protein [Epilithonimonas sp.]
MPFLNFENRHSDSEKTAINSILQTLQSILSGKFATLTPEELRQYESINEQNKLIVNKVKDYRDNNPLLSSPEIDWGEFDKDYESRSFLQSTVNGLTGLNLGLENAKILHDWDNCLASLVDYQYSVYRNDSESPGFHTKAEEIRQFFP